MFQENHQVVRSWSVFDGLHARSGHDSGQVIDQQDITFENRQLQGPILGDLAAVGLQQIPVAMHLAADDDVVDPPLDHPDADDAELDLLRRHDRPRQDIAVVPVLLGDRSGDLVDVGEGDFARQVLLVERDEFGLVVDRRTLDDDAGEDEADLLRLRRR